MKPASVRTEQRIAPRQATIQPPTELGRDVAPVMTTRSLGTPQLSTPVPDAAALQQFIDNASLGNIELVAKSIQNGMPVNARVSPQDPPAIVAAARSGKIAMVDFLITQGALTEPGLAAIVHESAANENIRLLSKTPSLGQMTRNTLAWLAVTDAALCMPEKFFEGNRCAATAQDRQSMLDNAAAGQLLPLMKQIKTIAFSPTEQREALKHACMALQYEVAGFLAAGIAEMNKLAMLRYFLAMEMVGAAHVLINTFDNPFAARQNVRAHLHVRPILETWMQPTKSPAGDG